MSVDRHILLRTLTAHRSRILSYAYAISRDIHLCEDVYQDVLVKAIDHADEIRDPTAALAWARRVARNAMVDAIRRRRGAVMLDDAVLDALEADWAADDERSVDADLSEALNRCLDALPAHSRRLIELRYNENLDGAALASRLKRPAGSIYVSLSRLYRSLANCIRQRLGAGDHPGIAGSAGANPSGGGGAGGAT